MSCLVLLILVCHILGLFYGFCGKRPGNVYGDDCCNTGTGANWLIAAVYLTFMFSLVRTKNIFVDLKSNLALFYNRAAIFVKVFRPSKIPQN